MGTRNMLALWIVLLCAAAAAAQHRLIPQRPAVLPEFRVPEENTRSLDEPWIYVQTLYDVAQFMPDSFGAVPVGYATTHEGRAFVATLHTIFRTYDGGRTWANLDPQPPPGQSPTFSGFRFPKFISDITARPVQRTDAIYDTLYITAFNTTTFDGAVRLLRGFGPIHVVHPDTSLFARRWLTGIAAPDSQTAVAFAGFDADIYRNDSMGVNRNWDTLAYHFSGTWVSETATIGDVIVAVGSHIWRSVDKGISWVQQPSADVLGDADICFSPSGAVGLVCGGRESPSAGWARVSADSGATWSARRVTTPVPLRTAVMVNDTLGFAAGGIAANATGQVWRTIDGGNTWELDLSVDAEITEIGVARESNAYINVIAAGYFADFRGGVWRSRYFIPDTSGVVLVASQDTVRLFAAVGQTDVAQFTISNLGNEHVLVSDVTTSGPFFNDCCPFEVLLEPNESMTVTVMFIPSQDGVFEVPMRVTNDAGQLLEIIAVGETGTPARDNGPALPDKPALSVFPNPGNAEFRLSYALTQSTDVTLKLFDVTGREIATLVNGRREAGEHVLTWSAGAQASGVYLAVLQAGDARRVQKIVLLK